MMRRSTWVVTLACAGVLCMILYAVAFAQTPSTHPAELNYFVGETQAIGDGVVYSWVTLDNASRPDAIGFSFTDGAMTHLPERNAEYLLRLPELLPHAPFDHLAMDWQPHGHVPQQFYGAPHFDFHFYFATPQARGKITTVGADQARVMRQPAERYIPAGYQIAPPAIPLMGLHWIRTDFPEFHGQPFTASLIYGSYNGRLSFIEPMVSQAFLLTHPTVDEPLTQPKAYQASSYYPTRYRIAYDAERHLYTVALTGLTYRQAR